ncbi:uncharacterized protein UMAG_00731 [Mycosarcoma maydis]|uniref:Uncharacterized protein n=1 Tax=Mycosarcoma maydis TaxID=5270 RepID=A0A0D1D1Q6_MYCMD|nr:uncharacterized protein UMAG_00731 [Ustilago maydis 521]KIS72323.1 hypothetical protein UMAG_00731 [Ustilago maydis 521]|eukprot:XP_011386515.1 hypothetical protein UMAG_00731 [Ustilago maydis 521]
MWLAWARVELRLDWSTPEKPKFAVLIDAAVDPSPKEHVDDACKVLLRFTLNCKTLRPALALALALACRLLTSPFYSIALPCLASPRLPPLLAPPRPASLTPSKPAKAMS